MCKIMLAQINVVPGQPEINFQKMTSFINIAKEKHADIIIFPEMSIPGYFIGDTWEQNAFLKDCELFGQKIIAQSQNIVIIFGNIGIDWEKYGNDGRVRKYNAMFIAYNNKLYTPLNYPAPFVIKTLLPNYREFEDSRHFYSLLKLTRELNIDIQSLFQSITIPLNDQKIITFAALICEDNWSQDYNIKPFDLTAKNITQSHSKIDFFINISCSPYNIGKNNKRHQIFSKQVQSINAPLIYVNNIGIQNNGKTIYVFDGASTIYDQQGFIKTSLAFFEEQSYLIDLNNKTVTVNEKTVFNTEIKDDVSILYKAIYSGIKEFTRQLNLKRVVIGISGGIDAAVSAAVYCRVLGSENVMLINMPSIYNSNTTKNLAKQLANNLNCLYAVVPIQEAVDYTAKQINNTNIYNFKTKTNFNLSLSPFVLENIQARDRSARILSAIAASWNAVFSCNANKSELTIGYSTLYGDQAGFLAAFADVWKYQMYELANYLNKNIYQFEAIPQGTINLTPSAELSSEQNVDENKGDPLVYPYHDRLFSAFVECWSKITPEEILEWYINETLEEKINCPQGLVKKIFTTPHDFINDLERWWNLFSGMAVAKRIQAPPIISVSKRTYGFDHRESQMLPYYTTRYRTLKEKVLNSQRSTN